MIRIRFSLSALLLSVMLVSCASARPEIRPVTSGGDLDVDLWTTRGEGGIYQPGEDITLFFRTNRDCFVTIYDITTDGRTEILFPQYPDDGYVYGGMTYRLPGYYNETQLRISGPRGIEYLHAVASDEPKAFRFRVEHDRYMLDADPVSGDPFVAINAINGRFIDSRYLRATATTSFFVEGLVWYPRYYCRSCHAGAIFDPYATECPRYAIRAHGDYDYWWANDYHPVFRGALFIGPFWSAEVRVMSPHRVNRHGYVDCAWGFGNWHPVREPMRPYVYVERRTPIVIKHREFERSYTPVTYRDTRDRRDGGSTRTRTDGPTRTRTDAPARIDTRSGGTTVDPGRNSGAVRTRTESAPGGTGTGVNTPTVTPRTQTEKAAPTDVTPRTRTEQPTEIAPRAPAATQRSGEVDSRRVQMNNNSTRERVAPKPTETPSRDKNASVRDRQPQARPQQERPAQQARPQQERPAQQVRPQQERPAQQARPQKESPAQRSRETTREKKSDGSDRERTR